MPDRLPSVLLRLEGLALAVGAIVVYFHEGYGWILLVALALAPDVAFVGYAAGPRVGALAYDTTHTELLPIALATLCVAGGFELGLRIALIWLAHIGIDRAIGYGLKYPTAFADTHLQRV